MDVNKLTTKQQKHNSFNLLDSDDEFDRHIIQQLSLKHDPTKMDIQQNIPEKQMTIGSYIMVMASMALFVITEIPKHIYNIKSMMELKNINADIMGGEILSQGYEGVNRSQVYKSKLYKNGVIRTVMGGKVSYTEIYVIGRTLIDSVRNAGLVGILLATMYPTKMWLTMVTSSVTFVAFFLGLYNL